MTVYLLMI